MSGSISLSMSQQFNEYGKPLAGGLLYTIQAGTTSTPQNAYQDSALTLPWPNPIILDSAGRIPQFYLADGSIKIRLTDSAGVQQLVADNILVVGPSSGSGGGGSVDATTVLATGDIKAKYGTGTLSGFVRANGRTIGSSTSGATERANSDAQALFEYLWGADSSLTVSGGRGASANADWTANKTLALPDFRGSIIAGLDDMGNSASGRISAFGALATVLGSSGGSQFRTLARSDLPNVAPAFIPLTTNITVTSTVSNVITAAVTSNNQFFQAGSSFSVAALSANSAASSSINSTAAFYPNGAVGSINGGVTQTAINTLQPMVLMTYYIKL